MWTVTFWKAVAERAVFTFAETLLAVLGVGATDLLSVPWVSALSTAGLAALLSVLKSIVANKVGNAGPSFSTETLAPPTSTPDVSTRGRHERP